MVLCGWYASYWNAFLCRIVYRCSCCSDRQQQRAHLVLYIIYRYQSLSLYLLRLLNLADPVLTRGGSPIPEGAILLIGKSFAEICMKMKEIGRH